MYTTPTEIEHWPLVYAHARFATRDLRMHYIKEEGGAQVNLNKKKKDPLTSWTLCDFKHNLSDLKRSEELL